MVRIFKVVVPVLLIAAGGIGAWKIIESRPEVKTEAVENVVPLVRAMKADPRSVQLTVHSQGTVTAKTVTDLIPEVSGKVIYISGSMVAGGFIEKDEVLLRIDPHDYELALITARAEVAQSELHLEQEQAEAAVATAEWEKLGNDEDASPLVLRKPQVAQATAAVEAARARLAQAELDLERTAIKAPFNGRVQSEMVDVGQYVSRGAPLARLYSIDVAEVRLPLPSEELAFVDVPLGYRYEETSEIKGPEVRLRADWAGKEYLWEGRIVRTEGEIDAATRMIYVVAQVGDPYARMNGSRRPPLAVGMFVRAEILGKRLPGVIVLPRAAIRGTDTVYVIDQSGTLHFRKVDIFKREREKVVIRSGLEKGDMVCISPLETVVDGMKVDATLEEVEL